MTATVMWGANNIYTVRDESGAIHDHLRIKGKVLRGPEGEYNPLAPGDRVEIDSGRVIERLPRSNSISRFNRKRSSMQAVAANVDLLVVVSSARHPDYRAGFVDRVLVMAELEQVTASVVVNKVDLGIPESVARHAALLTDIGYAVHYISVTAERGIDEIRRIAAGTVVLFGQSGVGKSTLINYIVPSAHLTTGEVSGRYDRGRHTTTLAKCVVTGSESGSPTLIDTPGVRSFDLSNYEPVEIAGGFREFARYIAECAMPSCTHTHEPGCAVLEAVDSGAIRRERYDSYRRIVDDPTGRSLR